MLGLRRPHTHGHGQTLLANSTAGPLHKKATDQPVLLVAMVLLSGLVPVLAGGITGAAPA